jgi:hypothetical protein
MCRHHLLHHPKEQITQRNDLGRKTTKERSYLKELLETATEKSGEQRILQEEAEQKRTGRREHS